MKPMTLDDLKNAAPDLSPEGQRRTLEVEDEIDTSLADMLSFHGIDFDRAKKYVWLTRDESKTAEEHAREFFTPEEQAKLPGLK